MLFTVSVSKFFFESFAFIYALLLMYVEDVRRPIELAIRRSYLRAVMGRKSRRSDVKPLVLLAPSMTAPSEGSGATRG